MKNLILGLMLLITFLYCSNTESPGFEGLDQTSGQNETRATAPVVQNPILSLELNSSEQIGEAEAKTILQGMGLLKGKRSYESALKGLRYGHTYGGMRSAVSLNPRMKAMLFDEYQKLKTALNRYKDYPVISRSAQPELFNGWVKDAATELKSIPNTNRRTALMRALMSKETDFVHWENFIPTMGGRADTGFGQILPATAKELGINPYDPGDNIKGIAKYLNKLIARHGEREALARYNGGNTPPAKSYAYADDILGRVPRFL